MRKPAILTFTQANSLSLTCDIEYAGGKAVGLLKLPRAWVPEFIVLTSVFYEFWIRNGDFSLAVDKLESDERNFLTDFLCRKKKIGNRGERLIVRSNAPEEYQANIRGSHYSEEFVEPKLEKVATAVDRVLRASLPHPINVIIQRYVQPAWRGHMSNARRVSKSSSYWLVESSPPLRHLSKSGKIRASKKTKEASLTANSEHQLLQVLRSVAGTLKQKENDRFHCEWVWDGKRVWIVQADIVGQSSRDSYANTYINTLDAFSQFTPATSLLTHYNEVKDAKWKKLERPKLYKKLTWPTADIFLLTGTEWAKQARSNNPELLEDLNMLCKYPLVVRCDIASHLDRDDIMLRTSEPTTKPGRVIDFMKKTSEHFAQAGIDNSDWAFLLATLVPARASVMVNAHPGGHFIRVDALWGFPDGLLFFPHDTYLYYLHEDQIKEKVRYKGQCLLPRDEKWSYCNVNKPEDWESVLSHEEVRKVAKWGKELANSTGTEVQLMCLVRIGGQRGAQGCLPWHHTELQIPSYSEYRGNLVSYENIEIVSSEEDIERVLQKSHVTRLRGLLINPEQALLREKSFICRVARVAAEEKLPLFFKGSLLGHAYYLMKNEGAIVIPISPEDPGTEVRSYEKLVRDKIPAVIKKAGSVARVQSLSKGEAHVLLARKLIEEAFEVWNTNRESLAEEIADIFEVLASLMQQAEIKPETVEELKLKKREARGGFRELIYLEETEYKSLGSQRTAGTIPLFFDQETSPPHRAAHEPAYISFMEADIPTTLIEFSVSLIPPVRRGQRLKVIRDEHRGIEVKCRYEADHLIVTVSEPELLSRATYDQLDLFSEDNLDQS